MYAPPHIEKVSAYLPSCAETMPERIITFLDNECDEFMGDGWIGAMAPAATFIDSIPASMEVVVCYRTIPSSPFDGIAVARTVSASDGTWMVKGLSVDFLFDVIVRSPGCRDQIVSSVRPVPSDTIVLSGGFISASATGVEGKYDIYGGLPPYTVDVVTAYPDGFIPVIDQWNEFRFVGSTSQTGTWDVVAVIESSNGVKQEARFSLTL